MLTFIFSVCYPIYLDPEVVAGLVHECVSRVKAWASGDFLIALSSRPEGERKALVDDLFNRFEAEVRAEPEQHKIDVVLAYIVIRKMIFN